MHVLALLLIAAVSKNVDASNSSTTSMMTPSPSTSMLSLSPTSVMSLSPSTSLMSLSPSTFMMSSSPSTSMMSSSPSTSVMSPSPSTTMMSPSPSTTMMSSIQTSVMSSSMMLSSSVSSLIPSKTSLVPHTSSAMPITTPKPKPEYGIDITLKDDNNKTCLWFKADIVVTYEYKKSSNVSVTNTFNLTNAIITSQSGKCSNFSNSGDDSSLHVNYVSGNIKGLMSLNFKESSDNWVFQDVHIIINISQNAYDAVSSIQGNANFSSEANGVNYQGQKGHGFKCTQPKTLDLTTEGFSNITIEFKSVDVEPFSTKDGKPASSNMCPSGETEPKSSSIVPIAVGCALAGLIVIVLIAYLIGRRKSDSKGYQQV